ncbi:UNVERIFIED_CONTAM: putative flavin-containing monooxygenase 1 [Sesamum indicum]
MVEHIAIIGAGISGLLACKYTSSKGLTPIVFEYQDEVGGVRTKTIRTAKLQTPKSLSVLRFSWPPSLVQNFPTQNKVLEYIQSYAHHHGKPFGPKAKWKVTVQDTGSLYTEAQLVDFVMMCAGKYCDFPNIPELPPEKGPEVFQGKVIHSMEYSAMDYASAAKLVQGKRASHGFFNGVKAFAGIKQREHWNMPDFLPWGVPLAYLYRNRFSELLVHKPGQGILLSLLATFLSPLRWGVSKFVESHIKKKLRLAKHGMVPKHSFLKELNSCSMAKIPEGSFDRVEDGSIIMKKAERFSFCSEDILIEGEIEPLKIDLLVLATGFKGVHKLQATFTSPTFWDLMDKDTRLPLYRLSFTTFIRVSESIANLFTSEMTCRWLAELLDGTFKLSSITEMEEDVCQWNNYMKQSLGESYSRSCLSSVQIWYND